MELKQIDQEIYEIWKNVYTLRHINPINQEEEKEKFFSTDNYNPQFKYIKKQFDYEKITRRLEKLKEEIKKHKGPIAELLKKKIAKQISWINMLNSVGTDDFVKYSIEFYGKPEEHLVKEAEEFCSTVEVTKEPLEVNSEEMTQYLKEQATLMKLEEWKIYEAENMGATIDVSPGAKEIRVAKGAMFAKKDLRRLAVHELGVHALRVENAEKQEYKIFRVGTANYEFIEEGLAATMEEKEGVSNNLILKRYAGRVMAINYALNHSFKETHNYLLNYFKPKQAWQLTIRAKRGLSDTSKAGCFTKDYIYYAGWQKLKEIKDLRPLFIGRIALEDIELLKQAKII